VVEEFLGAAELSLDGTMVQIAGGKANIRFLGLSGEAEKILSEHPELFSLTKPYFIGG